MESLKIIGIEREKWEVTDVEKAYPITLMDKCQGAQSKIKSSSLPNLRILVYIRINKENRWIKEHERKEASKKRKNEKLQWISTIIIVHHKEKGEEGRQRNLIESSASPSLLPFFIFFVNPPILNQTAFIALHFHQCKIVLDQGNGGKTIPSDEGKEYYKAYRSTMVLVCVIVHISFWSDEKTQYRKKVLKSSTNEIRKNLSPFSVEIHRIIECDMDGWMMGFTELS